MSFWRKSRRRPSRGSIANRPRQGRLYRPTFEALEGRALLSAVAGDFNGDGVADLAVGGPSQTVNGVSNAGSIEITYGTHYAGQFKLRLVPSTTQTLTRASAGQTAQANDNFGSALAVADFNNDGFADLAVGISGQTVDGAAGAGAVDIFFGSSSGLKTTGVQIWTQNTPQIAELSEAGDHFGSALATGDFNGDHFADLAIGVPNEGVGSLTNLGAVNIIYGSRTGLVATKNQFFYQTLPGFVGAGAAGDLFGSALAVGDFNADGLQDLAIGAPGQTVSGNASAGAVNVMYGTRSVGLQIVNNQFWTADTGNVVSASNANAMFGFALAAGDFNGDSRADLAIGAPGENLPAIDAPAAVNGAGGVHILFGSSSRLTDVGNQWWNENIAGIRNTDADGFVTNAASGDRFGAALAAGQINVDHVADLAIGIPNATINASNSNEGAVRVMFGVRGVGLSTSNTVLRDEEDRLLGIASAEDHLGTDIAIGDFNGDLFPDLAITIPQSDVTAAASLNAAIVFGQSGTNLPLGVRQSNGLEFQIFTQGSGTQPDFNSSVTVNYVGTLLNGTVFDSSASHGGPQTFQVGGVIEGFGRALLGMRVGSHWRVYIPAAIGYGDMPPPGIPANADLIFDLELVAVS